MLNPIWLCLVLLSVFIGGFSGRLDAVTSGAAENAVAAVISVSLPLAGWFTFWLGMLRLAEMAGLVQVLARALRPLMRWLFPDVPADHPALGAMALNMAANMLGLGNAATPLGLKAMADLAKLNQRPGIASNAMCTFLAINTASIQLIPATAIGILASKGAKHPAAIVPSALMATACAFATGLICVKLLEKLPRYQLPPIEPAKESDLTEVRGKKENESEEEGITALNSKAPTENAASESQLPSLSASLPALGRKGRLILSLYGITLGVMFVTLAFPNELNEFFAWLNQKTNGGLPGLASAPIFPELSPELARLHLPMRLLSVVGKLALPFAFTFFPLYAWLRGVRVYEEFVEGAKEGFQVAVRIIPYLVAILTAVGMFRKSGGIDLLSKLFGPALAAIGFPIDLLPLVLVRPLSGSAATGMFTELVQTFGPDSMQSLMGGTIFGSTETTFYVLAVYFGSVGIRRTRHAVLAGLSADVAGVIASIVICRWLFG